MVGQNGLVNLIKKSMATVLFFLGGITLFGIPATIVCLVGFREESAKSQRIRNEFLKQFD